jgi:hypothetical protein
MEAWWEGVTYLNKAFAISALAFSAIFLVQIFMMLLGMETGSHADMDGAGIHDFHDVHDVHDAQADHSAAGVTFTFVSVRSLMAFGMLFSWAGTLYLAGGTYTILAIVYSFFWGLAGMFAVSVLLYYLLRMQETGNLDIWNAIGETGTVYMNIPAEGAGKVRVKVDKTLCFVNAQSKTGEPLVAGTAVKVVGVLDARTVEIEPLDKREED